MSRTYLLFVLIPVLYLIFSKPSLAGECLDIASDLKTTRLAKMFTPGISKVFGKAGLCINLVDMPAKRMKQQMMRGEIDGEYIRVSKYIEAMKKHVVAVPTAVASGSGHVVSLTSGGFKPSGLADIKGHKIGYVHGYQWHSDLIKSIENSYSNASYKLLVKQLLAKRIDGFLIDSVTLAGLIKQNILPENNLYISPAIVDLSAYLLLHRKNAGMIDKLDAAMKAVHKEGGFKTN